MPPRLCFALLFLSLAVSGEGATITYTSNTAINIRDDGPSDPSPSLLQVAGQPGTVTEITVRFFGLTHFNPGDIDALLVGPAGQNVMLISDAGEPISMPEVVAIELNFMDGAPPLPKTAKLTSGTYAPTNYVGVFDERPEMDPILVFQDPPPPGPYGATLSVFNGTDPNGTWKLYIQDDTDDEAGDMTGWSLTVTTLVPEPGGGLLLLLGAVTFCFRRMNSRRDVLHRVW